MPQGQGTYGTQQGRPRRKNKTNVIPAPAPQVIPPKQRPLAQQNISAPQDALIQSDINARTSPEGILETNVGLEREGFLTEEEGRRIRRTQRDYDRTPPIEETNTPFLDAEEAPSDTESAQRWGGRDVRGEMEEAQKSEKSDFALAAENVIGDRERRDNIRNVIPQDVMAERRAEYESQRDLREDAAYDKYEAARQQGFAGSQSEYEKEQALLRRHRMKIEQHEIPSDMTFEDFSQQEDDRLLAKEESDEIDRKKKLSRVHESRDKRHEERKAKEAHKREIRQLESDAHAAGLTRGTTQTYDSEGNVIGTENRWAEFIDDRMGGREQALEIERIRNQEARVAEIEAKVNEYGIRTNYEMNAENISRDIELGKDETIRWLEQLKNNIQLQGMANEVATKGMLNDNQRLQFTTLWQSAENKRDMAGQIIVALGPLGLMSVSEAQILMAQADAASDIQQQRIPALPTNLQPDATTPQPSATNLQPDATLQGQEPPPIAISGTGKPSSDDPEIANLIKNAYGELVDPRTGKEPVTAKEKTAMSQQEAIEETQATLESGETIALEKNQKSEYDYYFNDGYKDEDGNFVGAIQGWINQLGDLQYWGDLLGMSYTEIKGKAKAVDDMNDFITYISELPPEQATQMASEMANNTELQVFRELDITTLYPANIQFHNARWKFMDYLDALTTGEGVDVAKGQWEKAIKAKHIKTAISKPRKGNKKK